MTTRWYRCPEILVGASYGPEVDVWAIGCILAEMATGQVLFSGSTHMEQLELVSSVLGLPNRYVPLHNELRAMEKKSPKDSEEVKAPVKTLRERLAGVSEDLIKVVEACLQVDPLKRPSADDLLSWPCIKSSRDKKGNSEALRDNKESSEPLREGLSINLSPSRSSRSSEANIGAPGVCSEDVNVQSFNQASSSLDRVKLINEECPRPAAVETVPVPVLKPTKPSSSFLSCFRFQPQDL